MERAAAICTECGASIRRDQPVCPRCHRPRWYTLKKISLCLLIVGALVLLIHYAARYADKTLGLWFG